MGAHEQTSPSHESGGLDPKDLERAEEEEDIKDHLWKHQTLRKHG